MIHTVKSFSIVNEAELDVFLEFLCFFYDPVYVGNLISGSSAFSKSSLHIWKFTCESRAGLGSQAYLGSLVAVVPIPSPHWDFSFLCDGAHLVTAQVVTWVS